MTRRTAITTPKTVPSLVSDDFPSVADTPAAGVAVAVPGLDDEEEKDEVEDDSDHGGVAVVGVLVVLSDGTDDDGATARTAVGVTVAVPGLDDEEDKDEIEDDSVDGGVVVDGVLVVLSDGNDDDGATARTAVGSVAFGSGLANVADTTGAVAAPTVVPAAVFPAVARGEGDGRGAVVVVFAVGVERCGHGVSRS